MTNMRLE